jgi:hypothetical protein
VDLVEADVIDLQSREARVDRFGNDLARKVGPAVADPVAPAGGEWRSPAVMGGAPACRIFLSAALVVASGGTGYISTVSMS